MSIYARVLCPPLGSVPTVHYIRHFSTATAPRNRGGLQRSITLSMLEALLEPVDEQSDLFLDELAEFLLVEYECRVSLFSSERERHHSRTNYTPFSAGAVCSRKGQSL